MRIATIFLILFIGFVPKAFSSDSSGYNHFGIFADYSMNYHSADFRRISDCPSCSPGYRDGNGNSFAFGLLYERNISRLLSFGVRAAYSDFSALLKSEEPTLVAVRGQAVQGTFEHSFDAKLATIGIEPFARLNLFGNLSASIGFNAGFFVRNSYSQKEEITSPNASGTFLDESGNDSHSRIRNVFSGTLSNPSKLVISPVISMSYRLPLSRGSNWFFEPEFSYSLGISNIVTDNNVDKWKSNSLRFGVALIYSPAVPFARSREYKNLWRIDTVRMESRQIASGYVSMGIVRTDSIVTETESQTIVSCIFKRTDTLFARQESKIDATLSVVGIGNNGDEIDNPRLVIEEFVTNRYLPLLPYVFFDSTSSDIDKRYTLLEPDSVTEFRESSLMNTSAMNAYYNILNIVGCRLRANPSATLRLVGCNDGNSTEKSLSRLSETRAQSIKHYLTETWGIEDRRILVIQRNEPATASVPLSDPEKMAENRRVEIYSNDFEILKPVFLTDTFRKPDPLAIRFKPRAKSDIGISSWQINVLALGAKINDFHFDEKNVRDVDWVLENDQKILAKISSPFISNLEIEDSAHHTFNTPLKETPLEIITIRKKRDDNALDKEINRFNLILFDFDKYDIRDNNVQIIEMIRSGIRSNSVVKINGYTDRTGDEMHNLELSTKRANSVARSLMIPISESKGLGEGVLLFDNELPEGRFYCRTVEVIIETPTK